MDNLPYNDEEFETVHNIREKDPRWKVQWDDFLGRSLTGKCRIYFRRISQGEFDQEVGKETLLREVETTLRTYMNNSGSIGIPTKKGMISLERAMKHAKQTINAQFSEIKQDRNIEADDERNDFSNYLSDDPKSWMYKGSFNKS